MAEPVRWGVLSTAKINDLVLPGARASDEVDVVAVASRDPARAAQYALVHDIPTPHGSYEALLADPQVEAVYISLPNSLHVEWSIQALEAGKHVLCEKPLSRWAADAEAAFDAAARHDRLLMEAFMYRHHPQTRRLAELLAEGAIGPLRHVRAAFSFSLADATNVRMVWDLDGGALMDVGCYCVSGARLLAGEPEAVFAERVDGGDGVDVRLAGTLRFPAEAAAGAGTTVTAQFDAAFDLAARDELEAIGTDGSLFVDDPWHCRDPVIELRRPDGVERIDVERADSYRLELEDLGRAIRGEAPPLLGRADALGQARAIEALYRSAESGRAVAPG